jgi:hypothetical protein
MKRIRTLEALRYLLDRILFALYRRERIAVAYDCRPLLPWQEELERQVNERPLMRWLDDEPFTPFGEIR